MSEISLSIQKLAKNVLSTKRFEEAITLCKKINVEKDNQGIKETLIELLEKTPDSSINAKQLDYAKYDIPHLEKRTRDVVERSSASIEAICKWILRYRIEEYQEGLSLGRVIKKLELKSIMKSELMEFLNDFNRSIWNPAKHDYHSYRDIRDHLFSIEDTIFALYIINALTWELYTHIPDHNWRVLISKPN